MGKVVSLQTWAPPVEQVPKWLVRVVEWRIRWRNGTKAIRVGQVVNNQAGLQCPRAPVPRPAISLSSDPPEPLRLRQARHCVCFDYQRPAEQIWVMMMKPNKLRWLRGRAEKTARF